MRWTMCWYMAQLFSPCRCLSRLLSLSGENTLLQSSHQCKVDRYSESPAGECPLA